MYVVMLWWIMGFYESSKWLINYFVKLKQQTQIIIEQRRVLLVCRAAFAKIDSSVYSIWAIFGLRGE